MSSMMEDVNHLSREIGARPAGTEEERLAAMYIAENIQKRSGLPFDIEDFEGAKGKNRVFNALSLVSSIIMFLAILLSATTIPAFILTMIIAVLLVMEYFDKPILSNFFRYGISQNVVAKYIPAYSSGSQQVQRKRKVVIVSHYDSGKALTEGSNSIFKLSVYINLIALIVICLIPIFLLIKMFAFPETSGAMTLFCVILAFIFIVITALPLLLDFYKARLLYNEGANCNASGNAALIEIARQLGTGSYSTDQDFDRKQSVPVVRGRDEAELLGVVPEGAKVDYQVETTDDKEKDALEVKEESLASAKAAIAAFTSPRKPRTQYDEEGNAINNVESEQITDTQKQDLTNVTIDDASAQRNEIKADTTANIPAYKIENKSSGDVPDWFKSAQSKAKKTDKDSEEEKSDAGQRSRFAHTMDVMAARQEEEARKKQEEEEEKRAKLRAQIEAANKAAEEERKKKFGDKEKPFNKKEEKPKEEAKPEPKEEEKKDEEMSIDESFKLHQQENKVSKNPESTTKINIKEQNNETKEELNKNDKQQNAPTLLPEHSGPIKLNDMKQYAPLDDQGFISGNEMPENKALNELPEVYTGEENIEENPDYAKALKDDDKSDNDKYSTGEVAKGKFGTGSFTAVSQKEGMAGATGTFAPVKEELIEDASRSGEIASKEDMVISDADDSVYKEGEFTDTGAFAGKGYVDMPEDKPKGIFSRLGKKNKGSGKHTTNHSPSVEPTAISEENIIDDTDWEGGAFSNLSNKFSLKKKDDEAEVDSDMPESISDAPENYNEVSVAYNDDAPITSEESRISSMVDPIPDFEEQVQEFYNTSINMEVWLVALGSEIDENAGMKAFLLEHAQELRGAIILDIEALGAGDLSLVNSEGLIRKSNTASRLKRYVRQAANKLNVVVPSVTIPWGESSASYAAKQGFKTLKLVGMEGDKPAYYMEKDDVVENINETKLKQNVRYLLELIQSI